MSTVLLRDKTIRVLLFVFFIANFFFLIKCTATFLVIATKFVSVYLIKYNLQRSIGVIIYQITIFKRVIVRNRDKKTYYIEIKRNKKNLSSDKLAELIRTVHEGLN